MNRQQKNRLLAEIRRRKAVVAWNPFTKTVRDHGTGEIYLTATNEERAKRGLQVPWRPDIGAYESALGPSW